MDKHCMQPMYMGCRHYSSTVMRMRHRRMALELEQPSHRQLPKRIESKIERKKK